MPESKIPTTLQPVDLTGRQLGDYQLLRRLGRGGMADVYLAKQGSLRRNIALKILKPDLAKDASYVKRFQREAQAAANLVQANIVQIYEVGEVEGFHFIAQEYVQGRNLKQYLNRYGAVEPVMAINVLRQSALALQKAGELHVIHRDIKPANILVSYIRGEWTFKIADFGHTRYVKDNNEITDGDCRYMAPELLYSMSPDTSAVQKADIFSLGCSLYEAASLRTLPKNSEDEEGSLYKEIRQGKLPYLANYSKRFNNTWRSMIKEEPQDRPTALKLLKQIRKL